MKNVVLGKKDLIILQYIIKHTYDRAFYLTNNHKNFIFTFEELRSFCFRVGINPDNIKGKDFN